MRVTTSGNASLFHGVPDWVYEEEVFSADYALWWAPDASAVAFLAFDETAVDEYTFPFEPHREENTVLVCNDHSSDDRRCHHHRRVCATDSHPHSLTTRRRTQPSAWAW